MTVIDIFILILLLTASALCIALIIGLKKIIQSVSMLQKDINELTSSIKPLIESTQLLTENINKVTKETQSQLNVSKSIVNDIRDRVDKILDFEYKIRDGMENAVMPLINNLSAVYKGFDAFWKRYKDK